MTTSSLIDKYFVAASTKKGWWSAANIIKHMNHRYEGWKLHIEYIGDASTRKDEEGNQQPTATSAESTPAASPVNTSEIRYPKTEKALNAFIRESDNRGYDPDMFKHQLRECMQAALDAIATEPVMSGDANE